MVKGDTMTQFSVYFINSLNFFFIFSFFSFLIIKKIIPLYRKQITDEKERIIEQAALAAALEQKKIDLIMLNDDQELLIIQLQKKVSDWCLAVQAEEEKKIKLLNQQRNYMHEKKEILHQEILAKKIHRQALKKALSSVENTIKNNFENQNEQEAYLTKICLFNSKKVFNA
jgi:hypothetical protein